MPYKPIKVVLLIFIAISTLYSNEIKVGVKVVEPFVFKGKNGFYGYSIDILDEIAKETNSKFKIIEKKSIDSLLDSVKNKEVDFAIAAITINSQRREYLEFSYPYFRSGLEVASKNSESSSNILSTITNIIFSKIFLYAITIFSIIIIIVSHIIWWEESKSNGNSFSQNYKEGIFDAIYWAIITVTTVGYGDKVTKSRLGKFTTIIWVVFGYFLFAYFTASVTTASTLATLNSNITSIKDLRGKRVATIKNSSADEYLKRVKIVPTYIKNTQDGYNLIKSNRIDAVVYDAPILKYQLKNSSDIVLSGKIFNDEYYGIAFNESSTYKKDIDLALLRIIESYKYNAIYEKWFD
jgi:ABC-type amino acid transport substrate-binding protein